MPERAWFDFRGQKQDGQRIEDLWAELHYVRAMRKLRRAARVRGMESARAIIAERHPGSVVSMEWREDRLFVLAEGREYDMGRPGRV
jgi:hypothetical protein